MITFPKGKTVHVEIGSGGAGVTNGQGAKGGDTFITLDGVEVSRAKGGGGGSIPNARTNIDGGSGGGACHWNLNGTSKGGLPTIRQGNKGGDVTGDGTNSAGAGGGGAGTAGQGITLVGGGNGGAGLASFITGVSVVYSGGGGGVSQTQSASGGLGGGGQSGQLGGGAQPGQNGSTNIGGGGGASQTQKAGNGGSGFVCIAYKGVKKFTAGVETDVDGYHIHKFNASETFTT
jgi:hypothetical protein